MGCPSREAGHWGLSPGNAPGSPVAPRKPRSPSKKPLLKNICHSILYSHALPCGTLNTILMPFPVGPVAGPVLDPRSVRSPETSSLPLCLPTVSCVLPVVATQPKPPSYDGSELGPPLYHAGLSTCSLITFASDHVFPQSFFRCHDKSVLFLLMQLSSRQRTRPSLCCSPHSSATAVRASHRGRISPRCRRRCGAPPSSAEPDGAEPDVVQGAERSVAERGELSAAVRRRRAVFEGGCNAPRS